MGQLDLFDDFLTNEIVDWDGADRRLLQIQERPEFAAGELIAYQGIKSLFDDKGIFTYFAILKDHKNSGYPYHLGTFKPDLSGACYDSIKREYQLNYPAYWRQIPWSDQDTEWVWKNEDEKSKFTNWLDKMRARVKERESKDIVQTEDEEF